MDKDKLSYLADIATVRSHVDSILNSYRKNISREQLHKLDAKRNLLDTLFVDGLLEVQPFATDASDQEEIAKKLAEAKQQLAAKKPQNALVKMNNGSFLVEAKEPEVEKIEIPIEEKIVSKKRGPKKS